MAMKKLALLTIAVALLTAVAAVGASKSSGTVKFMQTGSALELTFANKQKLIITGKGTSVPEGTLMPETYAILKPGKDGAVWRLEGVKGKLGELASITVTKGQTTEIDIGLPLTVKPMRFMATRNKAGETFIPIMYTLTGKNGELFSNEMKMGARNAPLPYFQITDSNNKVLSEGQFEYG